MEITELGIITLVNPLQPLNAYSPIWVTELGIVMLVKLLQPRNASEPMKVTKLGNVTEVKPLQLLYLQLTVYQFVLFKTVEKLFRGFY